MSCQDYSFECEVGKYELSRHLTIQDVRRFFKNGIKCNTSIVYISRNDPVHVSEAMIKSIDDECNYLFREKRGWYFIYTQLFKNILLWSAHPRMYGKEGFVGNHLSIGEQNGQITLHHTTYSSKKHKVGQYYIIWDKTHEWYNAQKDGSLDSTNIDALGLWNEIARSSIEGGGKSVGRGSHHLIKPSGKSANISLLNISKRLYKLHEFLSQPEKYMVSMRIPYMKYSNKDMRIFKEYTTTLVLNHDAKTAFALINFE